MSIIKAGAVVIGAGPGGYVCGIRLGQLGIDTVVVEAGELGGVCLNVGCIPSKALITASKRYEQTASSSVMGISVEGATVDMGVMQDWKSGIVKKLTGGVGSLLKGNGVKVVKGRATLTHNNRVVVQGADGEETVITAGAIVLATGSRPIEIPGFTFDNENVLDSTGGLALSELPERLVVIGGGYIGLELGGTYARLGSKVTVLEMMDQLLPGFAKDLVRPVERKLVKAGADIKLKHKALGWEKKNGALVVHVEDDKGIKAEVPCDKILVTVGRRPNSEDLGLEALGVTIERGFVKVNQRLETSVAGIYAIGDLVGNPMLAHKASAEGEVCAEVIAGHNAVFDKKAIPAIVFTSPEVSSVGLSEKDAQAAGHKTITGKYPFSGLGRAMTTGETEGFCRVILDADTKELLGCEIVGPSASDLIAESALAIEMGAFADDIGLTVHAHPTLAEAMMEASKAATGEAIHLINR